MLKTLICNEAHNCPAEICQHKKPHAPTMGDGCGPSMPCHEEKRLSGCIPVQTDGRYFTTRRETCSCCGGKGHFIHTDEHQA